MDPGLAGVSQPASPAADVVIIGGGITGTAAAWALTQRGVHDVVVLERGTVGCGGTGKSSGIVRCHYGVPALAAMAWKGLRLLENAADVLGDDAGFRQVGYVVGVGPENVAALHANLAMLQGLGIETAAVPHDAVAALWPAADLSDFAALAYEPRGGYGDPYRTAQAFAAAARRGGADIRQGTAVTGVLASRGRVTGVQLASGERLAAGAVVIAAGPWSVALAAPHGIGLPIQVCREQILLVAPGQPLGPVPVLSDLVCLQYLRAEPSGELLCGNSDLHEVEPADPDHYRNRADAGFIEAAAAKLARRFPGLPDAAVASSYAGCYDITPDFNPVIGSTGIDGLTVAAGFSGHGFKISPAVGELIADLVCTGASADPDVPGSVFRLSRFAEGDPLASQHPYAGAGQLR
jgi:glycine/D-amino acid oxidase-like deaminating enzyme